ncbi:MAG: cell division protein SepF [Streptococcus parasanguinis]|nr:cell division protein SepF [Streptococcus parasanguinis]
MSLKDKFNNFIDYFTEDGEEVEVREAKAAGAETQPVPQPQPTPQVTSPRPQISQREPVKPKPKPTPVAPVTTPVSTAAVKESVSTTKNTSENITRLHERQRELAANRANTDEKITIDVRYPRKYEEATEIVDLLLSNESILIDFQYMTEVQARRCLDYLDGARYVLAGNLRRVASTMYLLTPINVVVNIEDIRLPNDVEVTEFDYDMKRNR